MYIFETPAFCQKDDDSVLDMRTYSRTNDFQRRAIKVDSSEGVKLIDDVNTTNFDPKFQDRYWRIENIHLIHNDKINHQYEDYRQELSQLGRTAESIKDTLLFSVETEKSCREICQDGYKVGSKKRHVLGHTGSGVHLVQHYDILTRYMMFQQHTSPSYVVVFKAVLGKTKPIVPRLHRDENFVSPNAGFDCHVSATQVDKAMSICEALNCSYVYLYEFDDVASNPVKYPRQILPFAIIQLVKKKVPMIIESPFLAKGSTDNVSNWEVKGETRRGFRFMFSKSGLKGRHKVFAKDTQSAQIGSYLKGQILEMRTKSIKKTSVKSPPVLKRIDDIDKISVLQDVCEIKPPSLQKVHLIDLSNTKQEKQSLNANVAKPINYAITSDIKFPDMHAYPQLLQKPLVKLKRLSLKKRIAIKNTASCNHVVTDIVTDKVETEREPVDLLNTKKNKPNVLCSAMNENHIAKTFKNEALDEGNLSVNTGLERDVTCTKHHKNHEDEDENKHEIGFENNSHKKKNTFEPECIKRYCTATENGPLRKKALTGSNLNEGKVEKLKKSGKETILKYPSVVNIENCTDANIRSIDTYHSFKEIPYDQLQESTENVSSDCSEAMVANKLLKNIQEDHVHECVNDKFIPCSNTPRHADNRCSDIHSSQINKDTVYSNQVTIEKSKSPVLANAAPDVLNCAPQLSSAQTYQPDKKVDNNLVSYKRIVKHSDKTARDTNTTHHLDQQHTPVSGVKELKKVLDADHRVHKSGFGKSQSLNDPSDKPLGRRKATTGNNYINVRKPKVYNLQNTMFTGPYVCFNCKEQINDAMVDLPEVRESKVPTGEEKSSGDTLKIQNLQHTYSEDVLLPKRICSCKHLAMLKMPSTIDECDDVDKASSKGSTEFESRLKVEDKTNATYNLESDSKSKYSFQEGRKTNHFKMDCLKASRIRSFLGSTAAAAMKKRQSNTIQILNEGKSDNSISTFNRPKGEKKTNNTLVPPTLSDMDQTSIRQSGHNRRLPSETFKERSILSPSNSLQQIDSTDDNDSQDTIIGGVPLSPVSIHSLHNRVDDSNLLLSSTSTKVMSHSFPSADTDNSNNALLSSTQQSENNDIPRNVCNLNLIKTEPPEFNVECNIDSSQARAPRTMPETTLFPLQLPRTQHKLTKCNSVLNAQGKSVIVDTLKELSSVLKYLTDNTGKVDVASVAEEMCRTLSSVHADKFNSCSNLVSSSMHDRTEATQVDVHIKQEPQDRPEYCDDVKLITASNAGDNEIVTTASNTVDNKIADARTEGVQDSISQFDIQPDRYKWTIKPSHGNDPPWYRGKAQSEQFMETCVTTDRRSLVNTIWNESFIQNDPEQTRPYSIIGDSQSSEPPCLFDPSVEPDILSLETFGNIGHSFDDSLAKRNLKKMTMNKHLVCLKNEPIHSVTSTPLKPKSCSLTIKSGVLNKGLKFNSLRRQTQTRKLIVRQFPTVPCIVNDDTSFEYPAQQISTDKNTNQNSSPCDDASELTVNADEIKHVNVHMTVCQKLEKNKEDSDDKNSTDVIIQRKNTKNNQPNFLDNTANDSSNQDIHALNELKNVEEIVYTDSITSQSTKKVNDTCKNSRNTTVKKKTSDFIPFQTVIRLKKQQYFRYKRGESQKKSIDYREAFTKYRQRRPHYGIKTAAGKPFEAGRLKNVKMEPNESEETDLQINSNRSGEKPNHFSSNSKKSAISQRGTALIEDEHCDQTGHLGILTTSTTENHSGEPPNYSYSNPLKSSTKEHSQTHKRETAEKHDDYRSSSRRSRSRSSHGSHTSNHSRKRKSEKSTFVLHGNRKTYDKYAANRHQDLHKCKQYHRSRTDNLRLTGYRSHDKHSQYVKSSFSKSGTGYFSWRRKYQHSHIKRSRHEPVLVTGKRNASQKCEQIEWYKFKQRENLRMKIENAVKEYRKTFEFTADDQKGDKKVASYLHLLTKKLDEIQRKRDLIDYTNVKHSSLKEKGRKDASVHTAKRKAKLLSDKLERSRSFGNNVTQQNASFSKFSDVVLHKQYYHKEEIESYVKQHLEGHCEQITKQIKEEITQEMEELKSTNMSEDTVRRKTDTPDRVNFHFGRGEYGNNYLDRHGSVRSRMREEMASKLRPRKRSDQDGNRETHKQKGPTCSKLRRSPWYKNINDRSDRYRSNNDWDYKRYNHFLYKNIECNGRQNNKRRPVSRHEKTCLGKKFDKYDFQENFHRYKHNHYDRTNDVCSHRYKAWHQNKYDKFSCSHEDKRYGIHRGSHVPSRFKSCNHVDDDHFHACRRSTSLMRSSGYREYYRDHSVHDQQHDREKHSGFYKVRSHHTKRDFCIENSSRGINTSSTKSDSVDSVKNKTVKVAKTDKKQTA